VIAANAAFSRDVTEASGGAVSWDFEPQAKERGNGERKSDPGDANSPSELIKSYSEKRRAREAAAKIARKIKPVRFEATFPVI
jgi:hypothetical protein